MFVCGYNQEGGLGEKPNKKNNDGYEIICPPCKSHIDLSSLLSISLFRDHIVIINKKFQAYAIGNNTDGRISPMLPQKKFSKETEIIFKDESGQPVKFISAVCGEFYTLYHVQKDTISNESQLIFVSEKIKNPFFLNIFGRTHLSLFGGFSTAAVIDAEGNISIILKDEVIDQSYNVKQVKLPSGNRAIEIACCNEFLIAIDSKGLLFEYSETQSFKKVDELKGQKFVSVSGCYNHCFAVCEDGRVFGKGSNWSNKLCFPSSISYLNKFKLIESLKKYKIVSAYAGSGHSIFKTSTGKIIGCGSNTCGHLFLNEPIIDPIFPPIELPSFYADPFFIIGNTLTVVMNEENVPQNIPNRKINLNEYSQLLPKSDTKLTSRNENSKRIKRKFEEQVEKIRILEKENLKLKKEKEEFEIKEENYKIHINELEKQIKELTKNKISSNIEFEILDEKSLSDFQRIKKIGRGATSEVFEVTRDIHFAQKFLLFDDEIEVEDMKRFIREYETLIRLNSPYIIKAYGISFGTETESPSIILELCSCNLKQNLKNLNDEQRCRVICEVSKGMKDVHKAGIIHRDLKLENILLDKNNHVKLSDFGLCTLIKSDSSTSRSLIAGTLKFMAPELIQEKIDYNEKVDVYAFGVVVYVIVMNGEFPKVSIADVGAGKKAKIPSNVTEFTRDLINRCWSFDPSDRPSFDDIVTLLERNKDKVI